MGKPRFFVLLGALGVASCGAQTPPGPVTPEPGECSTDIPCSDGRICVDGVCEDPCNWDDECDAGWACRGGFCHEADCGDGLVELEEGCDNGEDNSDTQPNACRSDCQPSYCGDGVRDSAEECDDGNEVDDDGCLNVCLTGICGDGILQPPAEDCDDGNGDNSDACPDGDGGTCLFATCGDGFWRPDSEECDDGEANSDSAADACREDCRSAHCGDGVADTGEECDDGNDNNRDACTVGCVAQRCGDGVVGEDEECDDGDADNSDACPDGEGGTCRFATCGDGFVRVGAEECDDGAENSDLEPDACRTDCAPASCGDGVRDSGEECDDGNAEERDACRSNCVAARCGDGIVHLGVEECDDGNDDNTDICPAGAGGTCVFAFCGDGFLRAGVEVCDDGNRVRTDDCPDGPGGTCQPAFCGDGVTRAGVEECDDANGSDTDSCLPGCVAARCGDGILWAAVEACDDGNGIDDDDCTNDCRSPGCGDGIVQPPEQCDDANLVNTDDCLFTCLTPSCGDGFLWLGHEGCDDGNQVLTDACPDGAGGTCQPAKCGDGFVFVGMEECDDGNDDTSDACPDGSAGTCQNARCGDGFVRATVEECDDGDLDLTDACPDGATGSCENARCGDGFLRVGVETCDDGNGVNTDACPDAAGGTCEPARCGDGLLFAGVEQCDDGDEDSTDACPDGAAGTCEAARCGDGLVWAGLETCDDGNDIQDDACPDGASGTCAPARCGDGFIHSGVEECDDGNEIETDSCPDGAGGTCETARCGDGYTQSGVEGCDDGNETVTDACPDGPLGNCEPAACGDGFVHQGVEGCDDGNSVLTDACPDGAGGTCQPAACGDGFLYGGVEGCDDGNGVLSDACPDGPSGTCVIAWCGDGFLRNGVEQCDDGNETVTDACPDGATGSCVPAFCGDGFLRAGVEMCDDGNQTVTDACPDGATGSCVAAFCGDGHLQAGVEQCDDGNSVLTDSCPDGATGSCIPAACGDGWVRSGFEQCDDGDQDNTDDCPDGVGGTCRPARCGDGFVHTGVEDCDDGNAAVTDGCPDGPGGTCQPAACGDGFLWIGTEGCDDGNSVLTDSCPDGAGGTCEPAKCGDGFVFTGMEGCDDGNGILTDGCPDGPLGTCEPAVCGDGFVYEGVEGCDDGNAVLTDACPDGASGTCVAAWCGDGFVRAGVEQCDDGNAVLTDACPDGAGGTCELARCGDGFVRAGVEQCDDGNKTVTDGCPDGPGAPCQPATCGDGFVRAGVEQCDDGNSVLTDACPDGPSGTCQSPFCGDGFLRSGVEVCDDGNSVLTDGCPSGVGLPCVLARCGDGYLYAGVEDCDDGNSVLTDACPDGASGTCVTAWCGDGFVRAGAEQCDDGNSVLTDACPDGASGTCQNPFCGDGFLRAGVEECDDGNNVMTDGCPSGMGLPCVLARCGDGYIEAGVEECDDGNLVLTDACPDGPSGTCQNPFCGDGYIEAGVEECDDGNSVLTDACLDGPSGSCEDAACGDGVVFAGVEGCDDGDLTVTDACPDGPGATCEAAFCGDGFVYAAIEECDDGAGNDDSIPNACRIGCLLPVCGDGVRDNLYGEQCDDADGIDGDGCDNNCTFTACGNGIRTAGESCDDGNILPGDACNPDCTLVTRVLTIAGVSGGWIDAAVDPVDPNVIVALDADRYVRRTLDAAADPITWTNLCRAPTISDAFITLSPAPDRTAYVSSNSAIYRVEALAGASCPSITGSLGNVYGYWSVTSFAVSASTGDLFAWVNIDTTGTLYLSADHGRSWSRRPHDIDSTAQRGYLTVDPLDQDHILVIRENGGNEGAYRTVDGWQWSLVSSGIDNTYSSIRFDPAPAHANYVYAREGYVSSDDGATWTASADHIMSYDWDVDSAGAGYDLAPDGTDTLLRRAPDMRTPVWGTLGSFPGPSSEARVSVNGNTIATIVDRKLYVSMDGGGSFTAKDSPADVSSIVSSIDGVNGILYGTLPNWTVVKSTSAGATWAVAYSPVGISPSTNSSRILVNPADPAGVLVHSIGDSVYNTSMIVSHDAMGTALSHSNGNYSWGNIAALDATDANLVYLFGWNSRSSTDGGDTFAALSPNPFPNVWYPRTAAVNPADSDLAWVSDDGNLWEYDRGPGTRTNVASRASSLLGSNPAAVEVYASAPDPWTVRVLGYRGQVAVSTAAAAASLNPASEFALVSGATPLTSCSRRLLKSMPGNRDILATACWSSSNGAAWSFDGGSTWTQANDSPTWPPLSCSVRDLAITEAVFIFACSNRSPVYVQYAVPVCGDGAAVLPEECDDGAGNDDATADACRTNCHHAWCGDGVKDTSEECDDGNATDGDGCDRNCTITGCGNGVLLPPESCDDGAANSNTAPDACRTDCSLPWCGDLVIDVSFGEDCDSPGKSDVDPDACRTDCRKARCGDGIVDTGEDCEDGNALDGDGCDSNCTATGCGNGIVTAGEECDNGVINSDTIPNRCREDCTNYRCGDGVVDPMNGETCDDGNLLDGDACRPDCNLDPRPLILAGPGTGWVDVAVDPVDPKVIVALDADRYVRRTLDATADPILWAKMCRAPTTSDAFITISPAPDRTAYVSSNSAIYRVESLAGAACPSITGSLGSVYGYWSVTSFSVSASTGDLFAWVTIDTKGALFLSADHGRSWLRRPHNIDSTAQRGYLTVDPLDQDRVLVIRESGGVEGVYLTTDGWQWSLVSTAIDNTYSSIRFDLAAAHAGYVYAREGYVSADDGATWTASGDYNMSYDWDVDISGAGYEFDTGGSSTFLRRAPDMTAPVWSEVEEFTLGADSNARVSVSGGTIAVVVLGRLSISTNGGSTFAAKDSPADVSSIVSSIDGVSGVLYGTLPNWTVIKSTNAGATWATAYSPVSISPATNASRILVNPADAADVLVHSIGDSVYNASMIVSHDAMATAIEHNNGNNSWGNIAALDPTDANLVYLFGMNSRSSVDGGDTFTALSPNPFPNVWYPRTAAVNPVDSDLAWVSDDGNLWEYDRGPGTRTNVASRASSLLGSNPAAVEVYASAPGPWTVRVLGYQGQVAVSTPAAAASVNPASEFVLVSGAAPLSSCNRRLLKSIPSNRDTLATACWSSSNGAAWSFDGGSTWTQANNIPTWAALGCSVRDLAITEAVVIFACSNRSPVYVQYAVPVCGDGTVVLPEECDDGAGNDDATADACRTDCHDAWCGDGIQDASEECDDGNATDGDGCDSNCTITGCGNGVLLPPESCDDGAANSNTVPDACRTSCSLPWCGDLVIDVSFGEDCDSPGKSDVDPDACRTDCRKARCGDGIVDTGEDCEDGNTLDGDGCDSNCTATGCGNGIVTAGEECDDGVINSDTIPNRCREDCTNYRCGDGVVDLMTSETCDDGNLVEDDGCTNACKYPPLSPFDFSGMSELPIWLDVAVDPADPNTLYALDTRGAAMKSTDAGMRWRHLCQITGTPQAANTQLFVSPAGDGAVYLGYSSDLYRVDNIDGANCVNLTASIDAVYIQSGSSNVAIDPASGTLYVWEYGPPYGRLRRSLDHGETWSEVIHGIYSVPTNRGNMAIDPGDSAHILMVRQSVGVFERVTHNEPFTPVTGAAFNDLHHSIAFDPIIPNLVYTNAGFRSDDNGATWVADARYTMSRDWEVEPDGVAYRLSEVGATTVVERAADMSDPDWQPLPGGGTFPGWSADNHIAVNGNTIAVVTTGALHISTDGGINFSEASLETPPVLFFAAVDSADGQHIYASNPDWGLYASEDGGVNWSAVYTASDPGQPPGVRANPASPQQVYVYAFGQSVYERQIVVTHNGFAAATLSTGGVYSWATAVAMSVTNPGILYSFGMSDSFRSDDGGDTFTRLTGSSFDNVWYPMMSYVDPGDDNIVWVVDGNGSGLFREYVYGVDTSLRNVTGRVSSSLLTGPAGMEMHDAGAGSYPLRVIDRTGGLAVSFDRAQTFAAVNTTGGLSSCNQRYLKSAPTNRDVLVTACWSSSSGAAFSVDGGVTWGVLNGTDWTSYACQVRGVALTSTAAVFACNNKLPIFKLYTASTCGDGNPTLPEACDAGGANSDAPGAVCRTDCTLAGCGDGIVDPAEECDDGNTDDTDGCTSRCSICGNGAVAPVELCDEGGANSDAPNAACRLDCQPGRCGDGILDAGEICDDGNNSGADGCRADCQGNEICGDGLVDTDIREGCDDGAANSDSTPDACRTSCTGPSCADNVTDAGEDCDDGNTANFDGCTAFCTTDYDPEPSCLGEDDDYDMILDEGCGGAPPGLPINNWVQYDFAYYDWKVDCNGARYIKSTAYPVGQLVGVILCSPTRYKIMLGETPDGNFYSVGDGSGSGEDHCEFVGGTNSSLSVDYSSYSGIPGYRRSSVGQTPTFSTLSSGYWVPSWYECTVSIP